jgi:hypothetical protein
MGKIKNLDVAKFEDRLTRLEKEVAKLKEEKQ